MTDWKNHSSPKPTLKPCRGERPRSPYRFNACSDPFPPIACFVRIFSSKKKWQSHQTIWKGGNAVIWWETEGRPGCKFDQFGALLRHFFPFLIMNMKNTANICVWLYAHNHSNFWFSILTKKMWRNLKAVDSTTWTTPATSISNFWQRKMKKIIYYNRKKRFIVFSCLFHLFHCFI